MWDQKLKSHKVHYVINTMKKWGIFRFGFNGFRSLLWGGVGVLQVTCGPICDPLSDGLCVLRCRFHANISVYFRGPFGVSTIVFKLVCSWITQNRRDIAWMKGFCLFLPWGNVKQPWCLKRWLRLRQQWARRHFFWMFDTKWDWEPCRIVESALCRRDTSEMSPDFLFCAAASSFHIPGHSHFPV